MRGTDHQQSSMFSYISAEQRVPRDHPLRAVREMADAALKELGPRLDALYAAGERLLMEQLDYNFLFRWFVGLGIDDPVWGPTVFSKNRDRLLKGEVAELFFSAVVEQARTAGLLSDEHFTVDGTLIEAWAGHKSFKRKDQSGERTPPDDPGNPSIDFHGERRTNQTHQSTTDPAARLARKGAGKEAKLSYAGHVLMDNRHGLAVGSCVNQAGGRTEVEAALELVETIPGFGRATLGADKGYDRREFIQELRDHNVTPHIAKKPRSGIDARTTRHRGYAISQQKRKRIEEIFGWLKTVAGLRKTRHRGVARVGWMFTFALAAYNLVRMRNLRPAPA